MSSTAASSAVSMQSPVSPLPLHVELLRPARPRPARLSAQDAAGLSRQTWLVLLLGVLALHVAGLWALWQLRVVREVVAVVAPTWVSWVAMPDVATPPPVEPPPPAPALPRPAARTPPRVPVLSAPETSPVEFKVAVPEAPPPPAEVPVVTPAPAAAPLPLASPALPVAAAAPAPSPPSPPPQVIPASAVQYLQAPSLVYPRLSRRLGESGTVKLRVWIDAAGLPGTVQVHQSSGHARLDEAALAAVRQARFKPYTLHGQPTAGWAFIPLSFDLEP
jgi:periplasmic protein TonB